MQIYCWYSEAILKLIDKEKMYLQCNTMNKEPYTNKINLKQQWQN